MKANDDARELYSLKYCYLYRLCVYLANGAFVCARFPNENRKFSVNFHHSGENVYKLTDILINLYPRRRNLYRHFTAQQSVERLNGQHEKRTSEWDGAVVEKRNV